MCVCVFAYSNCSFKSLSSHPHHHHPASRASFSTVPPQVESNALKLVRLGNEWNLALSQLFFFSPSRLSFSHHHHHHHHPSLGAKRDQLELTSLLALKTITHTHTYQAVFETPKTQLIKIFVKVVRGTKKVLLQFDRDTTYHSLEW